ncbi:hypothetical protein GCM10022261_17450 [Brevibacterium daeguense]|uniref:Uncharacterized protein n=1 Tax=Brevibacterium daeguense TaxID=909936 RepID=A0ABP8EJQ9_9MICO|nr:hypothetical protein [Brevibacterium daeguense]
MRWLDDAALIGECWEVKVENLLTEALEILGDTDADDSTAEARGRRAHARVLAMVEMTNEAALARREQRIANLLALAQLDKKDSAWALKEAREMLSDSTAAAPLSVVS